MIELESVLKQSSISIVHGKIKFGKVSASRVVAIGVYKKIIAKCPDRVSNYLERETFGRDVLSFKSALRSMVTHGQTDITQTHKHTSFLETLPHNRPFGQ